MKNNVKFILLVGLLILALTLAVGCGDKDTKDPGTDTTGQTQSGDASQEDQGTENNQATDEGTETDDQTAENTDSGNEATDTPAASDLSALGKEYIAANGCTGCHAISGEGGTSAPELTKVGSKYDAAGLKSFMTSKHPMPFSGTDEELTNVVEYLSGLK